MIVIHFLVTFGEEFASLIPSQRTQINALMEKGIISSYSLSTDRKILWVTLLATSVDAVEKTLRMIPLFKFMQYEIFELMFHSSPVYAPMRISMN
jgi:muconolactone delta-isomerase